MGKARISRAVIAFRGQLMMAVGGATTGDWERRRAKPNAALKEAPSRMEEDHAPALS